MSLHIFFFSDYTQCTFFLLLYHAISLLTANFFLSNCDGQTHDPKSPGIHILSYPLSFSVGTIYDLLLAKRIWQGWGDVTAKLTVHKNVADLTGRLSLAGFEEAGSHFGVAHVTRSQEQSLANNQQHNQVLSPNRKLNAANNHVSLKADPSQVKPRMRLQPQLNADGSLVITWSRRPSYRNWGNRCPLF